MTAKLQTSHRGPMVAFVGKERVAPNWKDRCGTVMNGVRFVRAGFQGNWYVRCETCAKEWLATKCQIRKESVKCCQK